MEEFAVHWVQVPRPDILKSKLMLETSNCPEGFLSKRLALHTEVPQQKGPSSDRTWDEHFDRAIVEGKGREGPVPFGFGKVIFPRKASMRRCYWAEL
jgi:hypothetical protein